MRGFFSKERFGEPQFLASLLLLAFVAQCAWLTTADLHARGISVAERIVIGRGLRLWHGRTLDNSAEGLNDSDAAGIAELNEGGDIADVHGSANTFDRDHSALYYLVSSVALLLWPGSLDDHFTLLRGWLARAPGIVLGLCLGASVWYVARRLYGNAGGYLALVLFSFSPGIIRSSSGWFTPQETGAAWGAFGAIFTGIAVAHTLYAPREVVLWNWRRIVLLGIALAMGIGSQFSLIVLIPVVLTFLLYLAPMRRKAAVVIWAAALAVAAMVLLASYFFHLPAFWNGLGNARWLGISRSALLMSNAYRELFLQIVQSCPVLVVVLPGALAAFAFWRRAQYFGNAAPLLSGALFLALGLSTPHYPGMGFKIVALPFLFLFVAGVAADAIETRYQTFILPALAGLLASYALWGVLQLARVRA